MENNTESSNAEALTYYCISIEGIDKTGKQLIGKYIDILSNHKYVIMDKGLLSNIAYSQLNNRNYIYSIYAYTNWVIVYLTVDKPDWEIRCKIANKQLIDYDLYTSEFNKTARVLDSVGVPIIVYNTSNQTPYLIAQDVIKYLEFLEENKRKSEAQENKPEQSEQENKPEQENIEAQQPIAEEQKPIESEAQENKPEQENTNTEQPIAEEQKQVVEEQTKQDNEQSVDPLIEPFANELTESINKAICDKVVDSLITDLAERKLTKDEKQKIAKKQKPTEEIKKKRKRTVKQKTSEQKNKPKQKTTKQKTVKSKK